MSICSLRAQRQCPNKCSSRKELAGFTEGSLPVTVTKVTLMWLWLVPFRSSLFGTPVGTYTTVCTEIPDTHSLKNGWKHWQTVQVNWDVTGSPVTAKKHMQIWLLTKLTEDLPTPIPPYWESQQYLSQTWTRQMDQAEKQTSSPPSKIHPKLS